MEVYLKELEEELEKIEVNERNCNDIDTISNQLFICANTRSAMGDNQTALKHIKKIKNLGDYMETAKNFDIRNNCVFILKRNNLIRQPDNPKFASFVVDVQICFKYLDSKSTFLAPGDLIKFYLVPFSKSQIFLNYSRDFDQFSESSLLFSFSASVDQINTVFCSDFTKRVLSVSQNNVPLFEDELCYLLKCEAWSNDKLVAVQFQFCELVENSIDQFYDYMLNSFDLSSFFKK